MKVVKCPKCNNERNRRSFYRKEGGIFLNCSRCRASTKKKAAEKKRIASKEYYEENRSNILIRQKIQKANKYANLTAEEKLDISKKKSLYSKKRKSKDALFKVKCNLRNRTYLALKGKNLSSTEELLGARYELVKLYLESKFQPGMSWENYGEWHIDHIVPLASAKTESELVELFKYTNLQPLWAEDHRNKTAKDIEFIKLVKSNTYDITSMSTAIYKR